MKLYRIAVLTFALVFVFSSIPAVSVVFAEGKDDILLKYTPKMTEDNFRYLDEIYIEKYPELGLRWTYGLDEDKRILTEHTQSVIQGCTTDQEKVDAIIGWIVENIEYIVDGASYSYDVLYDGAGNCLGQSMLMRDMCRLAGIPAVWGDGYKGDMSTMTVEYVQNIFNVGHAWCFVYVDGEWLLYDPVWGVNPYTDRDLISQTYFLDTVENITPIYDSGNFPPTCTPYMFFAYVDGRFMAYEFEQPTNSGDISTPVNELFIHVNPYTGDGCATNYLEKPERKDEMIVGELFRNGWYDYFGLTYSYENGINAAATVLALDGVQYYMNQGNALKLCVDQSECRIRYGWLNVKTGFTGKLLEPIEMEMPETEDFIFVEPLIEWTSKNPEIASIDENGVITNYKEGGAVFNIKGYLKTTMDLPEWMMSDTGLVESLLQDGFELVDGKLVSSGLQYETVFTVYFRDDISRPTQFGKVNVKPDDDTKNESDNSNSDTDTTVPPTDIVVDTLDEGRQNDLLNDTADGGTISVSASEKCNALSFGSDMAERAAQRGISIEIAIQDAVVTFDSIALADIARQENAEQLTVEIIPVLTENLSAVQQSALFGKNPVRIYVIGLRSGQDYIHDFGDGAVSVTFPFTCEDGYSAEDYVVYYVTEDGDLEAMNTEVSGNSVTFTTNHFSVFALTNIAATGGAEAEPEGIPVWFFITAGVVLLAGIAVVIIIFIKKTHKRSDSAN